MTLHDLAIVERQIRRLQYRQSLHDRLVVEALDRIIDHLGIRPAGEWTLAERVRHAEQAEADREVTAILSERQRRDG